MSLRSDKDNGSPASRRGSEMVTTADVEDVNKMPTKNISMYGHVPTSDTSSLMNLTEFEEQQHRGWMRFRKQIANIMESNHVQGFLGVLLMISLFLPDSWVLGNPSNDADAVLYSILVIVLFFFTVEVVILSVVQDGYFDRNNFFFWMDVLGTLSIILDIGWISDEFMPQGATTSGSLLRAARAAKLGARYGRIMRLLKLMKFMNYLPCFGRGDDEEEKEPTMTAVRKVSNELSSVLSKRVAFLVLFLVIIIPFMSHDVFDFSIAAYMESIKFLTSKDLATDDQLYDFMDDIRDFYQTKDSELISVKISQPGDNELEKEYNDEDDVRWQNLYEHVVSYSSGGEDYDIVLKTDESFAAKMNAMFGILLILLVIFVLFGFSASFQGAVDVLVVVPLEKMMSALRESASLMLRSMKAFDKDEDEPNEELEDLDEELETAMLERMVEKLARLCKHLIPETDLDIGAEIDTSTAEWLREQSGVERRKSGSQASVMMRDVFISIDEKNDVYRKVGIVNFDLVNSFDFDTTVYSEKELAHITRYIFDVTNVFEEFSIEADAFEMFVLEVGKRYKDNAYHNFQHCIDVTHTLWRLLRLSRIDTQLSSLEIFASLLAALGHDMGHPGVNNGYLVKAKHDLAIRFNDVSPLENMHCSQLFKLLSDEKHNILVNLSDTQWREVRKIVIKAILGTDMIHHNGTVKKINLFYEVKMAGIESFYAGESPELAGMEEPTTRLDMIEWMLHTADVSNPYKPFHICSKWAGHVVDEFWSQGDKEREEKMDVSAMNDRTKAGSVCDVQMGFIQFMIEPLISSMVKAFPALYPIGKQLESNFCKWADERVVELKGGKFVKESIEIDCQKTLERAGKLKEKMACVKAAETICARACEDHSNRKRVTSLAPSNRSSAGSG